MAYARFSEKSDVYVYEDTRGFICCMRCSLGGNAETRTKSRGEMIEHMETHRRAGHRVLDDAIDELKAEIVKFGDLVAK